MPKALTTARLVALNEAAFQRHRRCVGGNILSRVDPNATHLVHGFTDSEEGYVLARVHVRLIGDPEPYETLVAVAYADYQRLPEEFVPMRRITLPRPGRPKGRQPTLPGEK